MRYLSPSRILEGGGGEGELAASLYRQINIRLMWPPAAAAADGHVMPPGWTRTCVQRWVQMASAAQDGLPVQEPRSKDEMLLQSTSGFSSCSRSQTDSLKDGE